MSRAPELSVERIAREALDLLDSEGTSGLTMRALAGRLGVKAASLYYHLDGQEALIYAMQDLVNSQIDLEPLKQDTAAGFAAFAQSYRDAYQRHPNLIDLVNRRPIHSKTALVVYHEVARHLRARGVPAAQVMVLLTVLDFIVLGSAGETLYSDFHLSPAEYRPQHAEIAEALEAAQPEEVDEHAFHLAMRIFEESVTKTAAEGRPENPAAFGSGA